MHDPNTQIAYSKYISLWHRDPEKHGDDDSCGWFIRSYHGDKEVLRQIVSEFAFNFKHNYWFTEDGSCIFSTGAIAMEMYSHATWIFFNRNRKRQRKFLNKYLLEILHFAENPTDSLHRDITSEMRYRMIEHDRSQVESRDERIAHFAKIIYADIMRKTRPWYKHPRWHIHHWRIKFHWWVLFPPKRKERAVVDDNLRETV